VVELDGHSFLGSLREAYRLMATDSFTGTTSNKKELKLICFLTEEGLTR
jgi:hypothetical protein